MSECVVCVRNTEPTNYNYVCANHHNTPVHKKCILPLQHCAICNDKILGILQCTFKPTHVTTKNVFLSDDMLRRAKIQYKAWHLSRLHKLRRISMQNDSVIYDMISGMHFNAFYSERFQCIDTESSPDTESAVYEKHWEDCSVAEKVSFSIEKKEIKNWFKTLWWDTPKCSWCEYEANGDSVGTNIEVCLPITICDHCNIGLCQSHLDQLYTEKQWNKLLRFGSPKQPKLETFCQADGCTVSFCKFRLFDDSTQTFDLHHDGPHGPTPISRTCLMQQIENDETGSLICEVEGCEGHAFCSFECKKTHTRTCGNPRCRKEFHVTKETKVDEQYLSCPKCVVNE